jgi:hypothetical protein
VDDPRGEGLGGTLSEKVATLNKVVVADCWQFGRRKRQEVECILSGTLRSSKC